MDGTAVFGAGALTARAGGGAGALVARVGGGAAVAEALEYDAVPDFPAETACPAFDLVTLPGCSNLQDEPIWQ